MLGTRGSNVSSPHAPVLLEPTEEIKGRMRTRDEAEKASLSRGPGLRQRNHLDFLLTSGYRTN